MRILENLFGSHAARLQEALGRTAERHRLLTGNLANISTPGYKRKDMDFAISLDRAGRNGPRLRLRTGDPRHFERGVVPIRSGRGAGGSVVETRSIRTDGNSVDLEREVAALTETQLHYSALSLMSQRYFQGLKTVIREGR
ncbi:MAG: flagellar basal body rod protein FlgB [Armatimonadetes bacterium]|nr:flagellar basal body rod protein FlgB [Armatimonadota bacterium]